MADESSASVKSEQEYSDKDKKRVFQNQSAKGTNKQLTQLSFPTCLLPVLPYVALFELLNASCYFETASAI